MKRLVLAALTLVGAVFAIGWCSAPAFAQPAVLAAPVGVTIPLPIQPGHFTGAKFDLRVLMDRKACGQGSKPGDRCLVQVNGHSTYALGLPVTFVRDDGRQVTAPAGMATDLASIPRVAWTLMPPDGPWAYAATIHDDCYRTQGTFVWRWANSEKTYVGYTGPPFTRADCDETFRQAMAATKVPDWKRVVIYEAVRMGGSNGWGH